MKGTSREKGGPTSRRPRTRSVTAQRTTESVEHKSTPIHPATPVKEARGDVTPDEGSLYRSAKRLDKKVVDILAGIAPGFALQDFSLTTSSTTDRPFIYSSTTPLKPFQLKQIQRLLPDLSSIQADEISTFDNSDPQSSPNPVFESLSPEEQKLEREIDPDEGFVRVRVETKENEAFMERMKRDYQRDLATRMRNATRTDVGDIKGEDPQQGVEEDIDHVHRHAMQDVADAVALGTARGLAGAKDKPTQAPVSGYLGNRNVDNGDIVNSSATGTAAPGGVRGGDAFVSAKESHNSSTDTLRPLFGVAPANGVIPSARAQIQSDVLFNDFSIVAPGNGLGVTNKMFLMEEMREKKIVYREPLAEPRKYDGPTDGVVPPPLKWQNEITRRDRNTIAAQAVAEASAAVLLEARAGAGSLNILGDDFGMLQRVSDKGLKRQAESPLEPIIRLPKAWERVRPLPGVQWARKHARRLFDTLRYPERFESNIAQEGGPSMGKHNALAIYPFPITTH